MTIECPMCHAVVEMGGGLDAHYRDHWPKIDEYQLLLRNTHVRLEDVEQRKGDAEREVYRLRAINAELLADVKRLTDKIREQAADSIVRGKYDVWESTEG